MEPLFVVGGHNKICPGRLLCCIYDCRTCLNSATRELSLLVCIVDHLKNSEHLLESPFSREKVHGTLRYILGNFGTCNQAIAYES